MRYCLLAFLFIVGCKNQSQNILIGKWKLTSRDITAPRTSTPIESSNNIFIIHQLEKKTRDTFDYILTGDTIIFNKTGKEIKTKALIEFINKDSIMIIPFTRSKI